ncbi:hypothetical protein BJV82DRAFT_710326 [Fennellomyces sp. T-0311]|nr:hypothetical protein BJV82DRAFT_710326 [Fennellomyces sp. T-0311]
MSQMEANHRENASKRIISVFTIHHPKDTIHKIKLNPHFLAKEKLLDRKEPTPDSGLQEMMGLLSPPATDVKVLSDLDLGIVPISSRSWIINGKERVSAIPFAHSSSQARESEEIWFAAGISSTSGYAVSDDLFAIVNKLVDDEADAEDENELNDMLWRNRKTARIELMKLAEQRGRTENCIIDAIASVIQNVPKKPDKEASAMGETELWSTFVDPVLKCLLSEPSQDVCLRWTNKRARENRISFTQNRPDAVISKQDQHLWKESMGFGEVKVKEANPDVNALARDLLRLAIFSKNSIDANALKGVMVFQVHGFNVTFYLMELLHDATHTLTKVPKIEVPDSLSSLHEFVTLPTIKEMARIHSIFWEYCTTPVADKEYQKPLFRETFDSPTFWSLIDKTKDRHRPCPLKY